MTRENIIQAIFDNENNWSCPEYSCDKPEEEGNTGECCLKCAEKMLEEYEKHIKLDAIERFADSILCELDNGVGGNIEDFIIESVQFMKEVD